MSRIQLTEQSLGEVHESVDTTVKSGFWRKILAFTGPAYLVSVGYMDPGNWATDLAGGSKYGYTLIWVLLMSNLMAILLQGMSARLGIVRRRDLAQANREAYPPFVNFVLYLLAEIAITACDLAEVLGMAIGIQLLTGLPLIFGICVTVLDTFIILFLQQYGMRKMEAFIISLIAVISISMLWELLYAKPHIGSVMTGFIPMLPDSDALYIAVGIIGATVMPHNLYLHSSLVQTRKFNHDEAGIRQALKMNRIDNMVALNLAFLVNAAILVLAASVFFIHGHTEVADIRDAQKLLAPLLGNTLAPIIFSVALIAAGQSSTITGTIAGQIVMEGYLRLRITPWLRRLITRLLAIIPAVLVISIAGESEIQNLLVFSQVLLSLQLGFAIIPLIHFVSDRKAMGKYSIKFGTKTLAWIVAAVLIYLNIKMVYSELTIFFDQHYPLWSQLLLITIAIALIVLLGYVLLFPFINKKQEIQSARIHAARTALPDLTHIEKPVYRKIALALDFSKSDKRIIESALAQGEADTEYLLIHITESPATRLMGNDIDDYETQQDREQLKAYVKMLREKNIASTSVLGHSNRAKEIVRIVKEQAADLLVIGGHGHTGLKDWIYGETVNYVRHYVNIPVLIVK
ncbi:MAG: iron/manganese transporter [Chitinophagaceae bacterium]|nr:MAG: iron/manganese transporter [Chitinophagaceae bacterium]